MNQYQTAAPIMRVLPADKLHINLLEYRLVELGACDTPDEHLEPVLHALVAYGKVALNRCLADEAEAYRRHRAAKMQRPALRILNA